ncbi:DUF3240 family protein [Candidatus Methylocalor cossyra]|uniref:DUF3240 domain-containing protein n=1 Tax=Candidatus Methylocalor cossyra TaxID=3108543 RepID=A0ABM9NHI3_9GAMM
MTACCLFALTAPPSLEEPILDWLLRTKPQLGFSSYCLHGHSSRIEGLTLAEQVSGRKQQVRFEMYLPEGEVATLIEDLKASFAGAGLHYWVIPLREAGRV